MIATNLVLPPAREDIMPTPHPTPIPMGVRVRGAGGGTALPNSGKTVGEIRAKQEECVKFRANQPLCPHPLTKESPYAHVYTPPPPIPHPLSYPTPAAEVHVHSLCKQQTVSATLDDDYSQLGGMRTGRGILLVAGIFQIDHLPKGFTTKEI